MDLGQGGEKNRQDGEIYDRITNQWTMFSSIKIPRYISGACNVDGNIIFICDDETRYDLE